MSFAALEARLNQAVRARLSNASATWWRGGMDASSPVAGLRVIHDRPFTSTIADGAVLDAQPTASLLVTDCPGIARKCVLRITPDAGDGTERTYTVLRAEPDGNGWVNVYLTEDLQ